MEVNLNKIKKVYFIGIGGIGISASARILRDQGKEVLGSDATSSEITDQLEQEGIKIFKTQEKNNITEGVDLVVYSVAVPKDNPERQRVKELGIKELTYPQFLGELMSDKFGIGIAGTNGKTSTTAMMGKIFIDAGLDPTMVIGGKTNYLKGNSRLGREQYFIFEADEYRRAFDNYNPQMAVVTYIAVDHLDYYKDEEDFKNAFSDYLCRVPEDGFIFINADDSNSLEVSKECKAKRLTFGINGDADLMAKNVIINNGKQKFDLFYKKEELGDISLQIPGIYNIYNFLAATLPALESGIKFESIKKSIEDFKGSWRRFEKLGELSGAKIIADYAHTPDAISKVISATKEFYPDEKILVVFQPHQYNRTKNFFEQFASSFGEVDKVIIPDIFYVKGRENPKDFDIDSEKLTQAISEQGVNVEYGGDLCQVEELIRSQVSDFGVVLILGAGDIYEVGKKLIN